MIAKRHLLLLLVILAVNIFIRFYELGNIPNGLSTDEADLGYNAFSILKTGQDVYGKKLPLFFQALDDYKPGLVFYSSIPAIAFFGLSDFSLRLAPAIFGSILPLLIFFLVRLLYPKNLLLAFLAVISFVFAPWSVALGRSMIWYMELITFYVIFLTTFILGLKKNHLFLVVSAIFLAFTVYVYYAAIIYLPFILIVIGIFYREDLRKRLKVLTLAIITLSVLLLPAISHYLSSQSKTRFNAISILTADITLPVSLNEIDQDKNLGLPLPDFIHNRRLVYASALLDNYFDYFNLDYLFLNTSHTRYFYVNGVGLFYLIELPFFLYGLYTLGKRREKSDLLLLALLIIGPIPAMITLGSPFPHRALLLMVTIQLISAIGIAEFITNILRAKPASLFLSSPLFLRSFLPPSLSFPSFTRHSRESLSTLSSRPKGGNLESGFPIKSGMTKVNARQVYPERSRTSTLLSTTLSDSRTGRRALTIITLFLAIYFASVYFFLHQYFVHSPREFTSEFDNGAWFATVRDAIPKVNQYKDNYDRVIFTWGQGKLVPAVYFLFYSQKSSAYSQKSSAYSQKSSAYSQKSSAYNQIDPRTIQAKSVLWTNEPPSYRQIYDRIGKLEFRSINWENDKDLKNTLLIGYPAEFPKDIKVIDTTYLPNGKAHFVFVETQ